MLARRLGGDYGSGWGYLARLYDPVHGDVISNPFDPRWRRWDLFGEIRLPYDFEQLAGSLIPDGASEDRVWNGYAQTLLAAVMGQAHHLGIIDTTELYRLVVSALVEELRRLVEATEAHASSRSTTIACGARSGR